ncbi:MAG: hypothetical protein ACRYGP_01830 [Janthinobacterium lividum]
MIPGIPDIDCQAAAMSGVWPDFRMQRIDAQNAVWRGTLRPFLCAYEVSVTYRAPFTGEWIDPLRQQPRVRILSPKLKRRDGDPEGPLPHVYAGDGGVPFLCLFDHETLEWTPFRLLAETTLPWSLDWLACYEGWRATGEWTGGGRHAGASIA